ncbi:MAG: hypothetical protein M5R42_05505 [Rhodocyclaceae bacterium]|nr:hypothetical protein [Rhodocyclaceae bacterium]
MSVSRWQRENPPKVTRRKQGELRGELVAAHAVDMRQRVEFRVTRR